MFCVELTIVTEDGEEISFDYSTIVSARDVCEYYFEQKYQKRFNMLTWYLEDGAKEYMTYIENKWLTNTIDELKLYNEYEFKKFMCKKYEIDISSKALSIVEDEREYGYFEEDEDERYFDICLEGEFLYAA